MESQDKLSDDLKENQIDIDIESSTRIVNLQRANSFQNDNLNQILLTLNKTPDERERKMSL